MIGIIQESNSDTYYMLLNFKYNCVCLTLLLKIEILQMKWKKNYGTESHEL